VSFYDDVLRQLIAAMGAALFLGNLVALIRRRADAKRTAVAGRKTAKTAKADVDDLPVAPIGRTIGYMLLGLVVMVWGVASLLAG
jgi:hypothetical protein